MVTKGEIYDLALVAEVNSYIVCIWTQFSTDSFVHYLRMVAEGPIYDLALVAEVNLYIVCICMDVHWNTFPLDIVKQDKPLNNWGINFQLTVLCIT